MFDRGGSRRESVSMEQVVVVVSLAGFYTQNREGRLCRMVIRLAAGMLGWGKGSIGRTAARRGAVMAGGASTGLCDASMYLEMGSQWLLAAPAVGLGAPSGVMSRLFLFYGQNSRCAFSATLYRGVFLASRPLGVDVQRRTQPYSSTKLFVLMASYCC
jgi:hypothetical protein